jgi:hypothetical protein
MHTPKEATHYLRVGKTFQIKSAEYNDMPLGVSVEFNKTSGAGKQRRTKTYRFLVVARTHDNCTLADLTRLA